MECCCSYFPHSQGAMITLDELKADIVLAGVKEGINDEAIKEFAVKAGAGQELLMVLLASGIAPVHGIDGRIEYLVQPDVKEEDPEEEAVVDMKQVQTFLNVTPGEKIAHIIPPIPGTPGKGVTGQDVPPNPGKPVAIKIGKNLTLEEDGTIALSVPVSGRELVPSPKTYKVFSKSEFSQSIFFPEIKMKWSTRFAISPNGKNTIAFHEIPTCAWTGGHCNKKGLMQTEEQLGTFQSGGCIRMAARDAEFLYNWVEMGTKVVVLA